MAIIISTNNQDGEKIEPSEFGLESNIQEYIYNNPNVIPLYDIDDDIKLFVAAREFRTESGPIDGLGFDENGNIYVIETKLFKNQDKRTVVAQVLDYGASLWKYVTDFENFVTQLNYHTQKKFGMNFEDVYKKYFTTDDASDKMITISDNLNSGNIKFVVLMDKLQTSLKDLIIYINQNSKFDIYAVELEYYKYKEYEIVIPKLFGNEVKKDIVSTKNSKKYHYKTITSDEFDGYVENESSLNEERKQMILKLKALYQKLIEKFNGSSYCYHSTEGTSGYGVNESDGGAVSLVSPTEGVWFYQKNKTGKIAEVNRKILIRLISEKILDKKEDNLKASQWSVKASFWNSKEEKISMWLHRFLEISEEEINKSI
ncbi:hypothetical protein LQZ19_15235 [Treponema primitia]|uniref:hypothetical protein n=1 Tax=Treponema primitia TaxID=88058 RepID=UPI00397FEA84